MARIFPTELPAEWDSAGQLAERETLAELKKLSDRYTIFYSQHWLDPKDSGLFEGEIDFVIVRDDGAVILLEQKSGEVVERDGRPVVEAGGRRKDVLDQMHRNRGHLQSLLERYTDRQFKNSVQITSLLYCPNVDLGTLQPAADFLPDHVFHAKSKGTLLEFIERNAHVHPNSPPDAADRLRKFLRAALNIRPSLTRAIDEQRMVYRRVTGGIADLLMQFHMQPLRLCIRGTAGCGKTLYGTQLSERHAEAGERVLYLCFNRLLAEELQHRLDSRIHADTFHAFCEQLVTTHGGTLPQADRSGSEFWRELEAKAEAVLLEQFDRKNDGYDLIVIDEGQDFKESWFQQLQLLLRNDDAGMLWMEDPAQLTQRRKHIDLPKGFAVWKLNTNYRTTTRIADYISSTLDIDYRAGSDRRGLEVVELEWRAEAEQRTVVDQQVRAWLAAGVPPEQILVITMHGKGKTPVLEWDELGGRQTRRPSGEYQDGRELFTDGEIQIDTVRRLKGLEAPAVIVTDVENREFASPERRRLGFVAFTRATTLLAVARRTDR